jgi:hypothetical protein
MWIKNFRKFILIKESLSIWYDSLLQSIKAQEVNIFGILQLNNDSNIDLEFINDNEDFINSLSSVGMKKSNMEQSTDYETFLSVPCRFMFLSNLKANDLETPKYLLLQIYNNSIGKYEPTKCYEINDDIKNFYDKLSSKTIEVLDGSEKYVYETGNGSNEWELKSLNVNDVFKKSLRKEEIEKIIGERQLKINVI